MSPISDTYNRGYNILELCLMFFSQQGKRNVIITNKNGNYELNGKLLNKLRFKRTSKLYRIIV